MPLQWAITQYNLGLALATLGERESGPARLEQAVSAFRDALQEFTQEQTPRYHSMAQRSLEIVLEALQKKQAGD